MLGKALGSRWEWENGRHCTRNEETYQLVLVGTGCKCVSKMEAEAQRLDAIFRRRKVFLQGHRHGPSSTATVCARASPRVSQQAMVVFVWVGLDFDMGN